MSKKARAKAADRRLKEKRARKAQMKARYAGYVAAGTNSKRKSRQNAKANASGSKLRFHRQPNRNRRRTVDVEIVLPNGTKRTVMRGGTISASIFWERGLK